MSLPRRSGQAIPPTVTFAADALVDFSDRLLVALGVPRDRAHTVSVSLVAANLRGVDSHGVQMLVTYIQQLRAGGINFGAVGRVASRSGACLVYDGENGLGQVVADRCARHAIRMARRSGLALVVARHSNHFGTGAYWGQQLARAGCIGIVMSNACPAVAPWQGRKARLGTNPICMAVPGSESGRWLLDMATTTVALGKLSHAAYLGQAAIPRSWGFLDPQGRPTTRVSAAQRGSPTPTGGYKGTGLGMMAEILCAVLSGGAMATDLPVFRTGGVPLGISHMFLAIDPRRFLPASSFTRRTRRLEKMIKSTPPTTGHREVLIAGEPEWRTGLVRRRRGVPVPTRLWTRLTAIAAELGVTPPRPGRPRARRTTQ
jgi:LDH2 family malate/lactate/ureidoglycolate dehydrogenase